MADKTISQLTGATTPVVGTEVLPFVQSGTTKKVAVDDLTKGKTTPTNGIQFPTPLVPSADTKCLDAYEEGTFTPALNFGGATTGITYNSALGRYTRIGNRIFVFVYVRLTSKGTATGNATITGLPVAPNGATAFNSFSSWCNSMSFTGALQCYVAPGGTTITVQNLNGGAAANLADTSFTNTTTISLSGSYEI